MCFMPFLYASYITKITILTCGKNSINDRLYYYYSDYYILLLLLNEYLLNESHFFCQIFVRFFSDFLLLMKVWHYSRKSWEEKYVAFKHLGL